jgi:hypothetical protein
MADKLIKNEQWRVRTLISKIKNKEIHKPKYQRKRKWDQLPKSKNNPNEKRYIEFLFQTQNSVHAITFGEIDNKLSNIDGNNRINAICNFLERPFDLFPEYLEDIDKFIDSIFSAQDTKTKLRAIIRNMTYNELMSFKYKDYFNQHGHEELYVRELQIKRDQFEVYFEDLQKRLSIDGDSFENTVYINVNLFEGYTTDELCTIFEDINKYNSKLTEIELLACRLYNITDFTITDTVIRVEIIEAIKEFYYNRTDNEALNCYVYDDMNDPINAYDFMVGFQNYSHKNCNLIPETDNDGLSLFFKLYKTYFRGGFDTTFTTANINKFIQVILQTITILNDLTKTIYMDNLEGKIFDSCNKKLHNLKKNNLYIMISAILGYIDTNIPKSTIVNSLERGLLYHFFVNDISNKEIREKFQLHDHLLYEAGGAFIENKAKEFYKQPGCISDKITKETMTELLEYLVREKTNNIAYELRENGKDKLDKRRTRCTFEKALMFYYYKNKVPVEYLKHKFWVEHIFPFSSSWENMVDIDRLGNIIPLIDKLNNVRGNRHISEYTKKSTHTCIRFIDIIPSFDEYDNVILHEGRKPHVKNSEAYNVICSKNEKSYIDTFIGYLY